MKSITCIHHHDMDGRCAAAIVHKKFGFCKFVEMAKYGADIVLPPFMKDEKIIIVDYSLHPDVMNKILEITNDIIWIDHHATAQSLPYQYLDGLRDFKNKSMAGCELTWEYFYPNMTTPDAVRLIGDLDKWAWNYTPASFQFYEGIKLYDNSPTSNVWHSLLNNDYSFSSKITEEGKISIRYRNSYCKDIVKAYGYETEFEGHRAFACNMTMFGSLGFGEKMDDYPMCIAYVHDGVKYFISMYSKTVDVGSIAKMWGGGGHMGAAGFECPVLPFKKV